MKRILILISCMLLLLTSVVGCSQKPAPDADKTAPPAQSSKLVVGATAKPHAEILEVVKPLLAKENVDLEIKVFTDYALLNPALKDGQLDANFFQHIPYLDDYNAKNKADLAWTVKVHNEPMGIYSKKVDGLDKLTDGAKVGIPNDATNGGRALMVLEQAQLIKLKDGAGVTATDKDIVENPKKLAITPMDAAMLPRTLEDADICVINSNYALEGKLNPVTDALFSEPKDSPFANVLAVRPADEDKDAIVALGQALQSPEVKEFLEENYAGSCVPSF